MSDNLSILSLVCASQSKYRKALYPIFKSEKYSKAIQIKIKN